jgi:IclR family acetate operon transcriptional repressor
VDLDSTRPPPRLSQRLDDPRDIADVVEVVEADPEPVAQERRADVELSQARSHGSGIADLGHGDVALAAAGHHDSTGLGRPVVELRLPGGRFDIGPRGASLGRQLRSRSEPPPELFAVLTRLHAKTRETSYISGWRNGAITLLQFIPGEQALSVRGLDVGYTGDLHARASCKSVLAHLPTDQVEVMFRGVRLRRLTTRTVCDTEQLMEELQNIRRQGYALDLEEFSEGICCVSAPFLDADGTPAGSFTVALPVARFQRSQRDMVAAVREAGAIATNLLRTGMSGPEIPTSPTR